MFTDRSAVSTYAVPLAAKQQFYKKKVSAIVVQCRGTAYLPICGKHKLLLVLNLAAGVSFLIINKLINPALHSWKAGIFLLLLFLLLLDLISSWSVF